MDERQLLLEYLPDPNTVKGGMIKVAETIQEQAPQLVSEILRWATLEGIVHTVIPLLTIMVVTYVIYAVTRPKNLYDEYRDIRDYCIVTCMVSAIVWVISIAWAAAGVCQLVKVLAAPRLYMLEYIMNLL